MKKLQQLFENNRRWVEKVTQEDPEFFKRLSRQQKPEILWIGCSDSRVPANQIVGLPPGEVFVHRNVGNLVVHSDLNCLAVLQFSVEVLKVKHIIVCGHYRCGAIAGALSQARLGMIENWIGHIADVREKYSAYIDSEPDSVERENRLSELNVVEQVINVCSTSVVKDAWERGAPLAVHGWIYDVADGLLRDLNCCVTSRSEVQALQPVPR
ncbi:MAG: carbonate dehydratase [Bdellovibrionales bacterium]|nr:carbonate dehydratase [Bdellovibrionales bacterium]